MFYNVFDESRYVLLKKMVEDKPVPDSYLAGGTGLAMMMGHRESIDFDFFTPVSFDPSVLAQRLSGMGNVKIAETSSGTFHGWIDGIQVTWLRYPNPLLEKVVHVNEVPGLRIASMLDIALMKWVAISSRGSRKDFIDLFMICQNDISIHSLIQLLPKKFPNTDINDYHMIKSLAYFDDAEREGYPVMLKPIAWDEVKDYFRKKQKELLNNYLKD